MLEITTEVAGEYPDYINVLLKENGEKVGTK